MNIYESLAAILGERAAVKKDGRNELQNYKFRGIDQLMNVFNPLLAKHKVFVVPTVIDMMREERKNAKGTAIIYSVLTVQYTFYAEDGSFVTAVVMGEGMDTGDKSVNKAMSAAYKYALFQVFCVPTEDMIDSEIDSHEVLPEEETERYKKSMAALEKVSNEMKKAKQEKAQEKGPEQVPPAVFCECCKKEIKPEGIWSVEKIVETSEKKFAGRRFCYKCVTTHRAEEYMERIM